MQMHKVSKKFRTSHVPPYRRIEGVEEVGDQSTGGDLLLFLGQGCWSGGVTTTLTLGRDSQWDRKKQGEKSRDKHVAVRE